MPELESFRIPTKRTKHYTLSANTRIIVMSDMHRGDGTGSDDFAHNSLLFRCALDYYLDQDFTYVELGDAEELWENKAFDQVYITHTSIYDRLTEFHNPDPERTRYIKVWGNHDLIWKKNRSRLGALLTGIKVYEAVVLDGPSSVLLLHGHQFDDVCRGRAARVSKFFVRRFWPYLQRWGFKDPTRSANNPGLSNKIDEKLHHWAKNNDQGIDIVVAGHTHRPVYENLTLTERKYNELKIGTPEIRKDKPSSPRYYNTGSCVHPRCITGIEITVEDGKINFKLIKWAHDAQHRSGTGASSGVEEFRLSIRRFVLQENGDAVNF